MAQVEIQPINGKAAGADQPDPDAADVRLTFGGTIVHVVQHNAQHRGEALHMLARLGVPGLPEGNPLEWELRTHGT